MTEPSHYRELSQNACHDCKHLGASNSTDPEDMIGMWYCKKHDFWFDWYYIGDHVCNDFEAEES